MEYGSTGQGSQSCSLSAEQATLISEIPCPHSRLRICSLETGSAAPSRISLLLRRNVVLTYRIPSEFRVGVHLLRHRVTAEFIGVTQLRTDGAHRRESAGTTPVNLKVVPMSPRSTPYDFYRDASSAILQLVNRWVEFYLLTFPRFSLRKKEHKSYQVLCKNKKNNRTHDFRTL